MGRPAVHTADDLVDAAVALFADAGAQAVTMTAVARTVGAPSGSVYHRFPGRPSLLAALWLRTSRRFTAGYETALGQPPNARSAVDAAVWCVEWCRDHPGPAAVLHDGRRTLREDDWPTVAREELAVQDAAMRTTVRAAVRAVAADAGRPRDETAFAMLDLPLAVVRPHLNAGEPVPSAASDRVRRIARRLLLE